MQSETESGRPLGPMITSFNHGKETQVKVVGLVSRSAGLAKAKGNLTRNSARREKKRLSKTALGE